MATRKFSNAKLKPEDCPIGEMFGEYLEVVGVAPEMITKRGKEFTAWLFKCLACGKIISRVPSDVKSHYRSCGCLRYQLQGAARYKHGGTQDRKPSPEYRVWRAMIDRCYSAKSPSYIRYGAVGVTICDEWRNNFAAFLAHVGPRPSLKHSIDRIDNERGYEPGNVRWATATEQVRNRRTTVRVEYRGQVKPLATWIEELGLSDKAVRHRLQKGWTVERAFTTPRMLNAHAFAKSQESPDDERTA